MQKAKSGITIPTKGKRINIRINVIVFISGKVKLVCEEGVIGCVSIIVCNVSVNTCSKQNIVTGARKIHTLLHGPGVSALDL